MSGYTVTDRDGRVVTPGDTVTSFRGEPARFVCVTRGPEYNGTAKVAVAWPDESDSREYYAQVFGLTVASSK